MFDKYRQKRLDDKLLKAVLGRDVYAARKLLLDGASPEMRGGSCGGTLLAIAAEANALDMVKLLLDHGADMNAVDKYNDSPLGDSLWRGHMDIARELYARGARFAEGMLARQSDKDRQLLAAAADGNLRDMDMLLGCGAALEARGGNDLHWNGTPLIVAAYKGHLPAVKWLLDRGADINAQDKDGDTVLNAAIVHGQADVTEELLRRGADPKIRSFRDEDACAVARKKQSARIMQLLGIGAELETLADPSDEVTFRRNLGPRVLEEVFNFATKERISLLMKSEDGPVEAMTRDSFSAIDDRATLRRAFEAYAKKGGKVPESEIFADGLGKPRQMPKP